ENRNASNKYTAEQVEIMRSFVSPLKKNTASHLTKWADYELGGKGWLNRYVKMVYYTNGIYKGGAPENDYSTSAIVLLNAYKKSGGSNSSSMRLSAAMSNVFNDWYRDYYAKQLQTALSAINDYSSEQSLKVSEIQRRANATQQYFTMSQKNYRSKNIGSSRAYDSRNSNKSTQPRKPSTYTKYPNNDDDMEERLREMKERALRDMEPETRDIFLRTWDKIDDEY
ncbi:MAG: hypothetical protein MI976_01805, partial [Pseudomonadales bacterium]|nr:hypothetical protein [Pseudomonadales bacterium]